MNTIGSFLKLYTQPHFWIGNIVGSQSGIIRYNISGILSALIKVQPWNRKCSYILEAGSRSLLRTFPRSKVKRERQMVLSIAKLYSLPFKI
jgi:hypothetical protein